MSKHAPTLSAQLNREAKWSVYLTLFYLIGWIVFAYFMPDGTGLLGLPLWFELSCIILPMLFILISMAVLKAVYKEVDLDNTDGDDRSDDTSQSKDLGVGHEH